MGRVFTKTIALEYGDEMIVVDFRYNLLRGIYNVKVHIQSHGVGYSDKVKIKSSTGNILKRIKFIASDFLICFKFSRLGWVFFRKYYM